LFVLFIGLPGRAAGDGCYPTPFCKEAPADRKRRGGRTELSRAAGFARSGMVAATMALLM